MRLTSAVTDAQLMFHSIMTNKYLFALSLSKCCTGVRVGFDRLSPNGVCCSDLYQAQ
jgi:hypothetical protein